MTDRKIDYNEIFCQAVDTILSKRLESLEYDQTIICRIVDNSDADKGHYIVRYGEAKFHAFSENTKYQIDDNVYVTIPKGDFTRPKLIISKYITNLYPLTK